MNFSFFNNNKNNFSDDLINKKDVNQVEDIFFEQYQSQINEVKNFLTDEKKCLLIGGYTGVGKTKLLTKIFENTNQDNFLFKYQCENATTLDDILLNLLFNLKHYTKNKTEALPKSDIKDFREKIKQYIKLIDKTIFIVIDSYENILSSELLATINQFLIYLANLDKIKIILISRELNYAILEENSIDYSKIILTSFDDEFIYKYLKKENITSTNSVISKFIEYTKGYQKYIEMSIRLLKILEISLAELIEEFEQKQNISYFEFILKKLFSFVPEYSLEIIYVLTLMRQSVNINFLKKFNWYTSTNLEYLINIFVLTQEDNKIFIKDYFKNIINIEISSFNKIKIYKSLINYYNQQLPLKPNERELFISRVCMHREIEAYKKCLETIQKPIKASTSPTSSNVTYLSYSKNTPINHNNTNNLDIDTLNTSENSQKIIGDKKISIDNIQLSDEEEKMLLENMTTTTEKPTNAETIFLGNAEIELENDIKQALERPINVEKTLDIAENCEDEFQYNKALICYKEVLNSLPQDELPPVKLSTITKLAFCYSKLQKHDLAVQYFKKAHELALQTGEKQVANRILFYFAQEYKNNFQYQKAKEILEKILNFSIETSDEVLAQSYLLFGEIEDEFSNISKAKDLYEKGLQKALKTDNLSIISTAYFKYALILDDVNQIQNAVLNYLNCVNTSLNPKVNPYLSSAYSNLAIIYQNQNETDKAIKYYNMALNTDKQTNNHEGLYFIYIKLAKLYLKTDKDIAQKNLMQALYYAKKTHDRYYMTSAYLEIGDFNYFIRQDEKAIKAYYYAQKTITTDTSQENINLIKSRLTDIRIRLGDKKYNDTLQRLKQNGTK